MVVAADGRIRADARQITFADVLALAAAALSSNEQRIVFDMTDVHELTTAGLAHLVALRLELLERGRDIHLAGLGGRPLALYRLTRMEQVLPVMNTA